MLLAEINIMIYRNVLTSDSMCTEVYEIMV